MHNVDSVRTQLFVTHFIDSTALMSHSCWAQSGLVNDAKSGVYTYPVLVALAEDADPDAFKALMLGAKDSQQAADELKARVLASSAVTETLNRIGEYNKLASACLSDLPDSPTRTGLMELPERYLNGILTEKSDPAHRTW